MAVASSQDDRFVRDVAGFIRRSWLLVAVLALAGGLGMVLFAGIAVPTSWEATATLVVFEPTFSSGLVPQALSIQGYRTLLESDAVVAETRARLVSMGAIAEGTRLRVGRELASRVFVSRRADQTPLSPLIELEARAADPELAATMANAWAAVFLETAKNLVTGETSATVERIERQYPAARSRLGSMEDEQRLTIGRYRDEEESIRKRWEDRIAARRNELADAMAAYRSESQRLVATLSSDLAVDMTRSRLESLRSVYLDLHRQELDAASTLEEKQQRLDVAREKIRSIPRYIPVRKAISDDALWQLEAESGPKGGDLKALQGLSLISQEPNPVHTQLTLTIASLEMDVAALSPRVSQLHTRVADVEDRIREAERSLQLNDARVEELKQTRKAGEERLTTDAGTEFDALKRDRDLAVEAVRREGDLQAAQQARDIEEQRALFEHLGEYHNQALIAEEHGGATGIRVAAAAVRPVEPMSKGLGVRAILGLIAGALLGLTVAVLREGGAPRAAA